MNKKRMTTKLFGLIVIACMLVAALPVGQVQAAEGNIYTVCAVGDCDYTSIQAAITEATAGDTIEVAAGTYVENITINKSITLLGAGRDTTTIQGVDPVADSGSFTIAASDVTVDGFEIKGIGQKLIRITQAVENVQFLNNKVVGAENSELASGWSLFESNYNKNQTNLVIDNNIFVGDKASNLVYLNPGLVNLTFTNNTFEGTMMPGGLVTGFDGLDENRVISGNNYGLEASYALFEAFGTYDINTIFSANTFPTGYVVIGNKIAQLPAIFNQTQETGHATIQAAIAAATAGDSILVSPGTYVETGQIVINKDLSIVGVDKETTIIKPAQNTGSSGDARGWFLVQSGVEFNLSNVTLDGEGLNIHQAVRSHGTGIIDNNIINNIVYPNYMGMGLVAMGGDMTFSNNSFSNIGRIGMMAYGSGVDNAQIIGNTYFGKGAGDNLDYGIEIGGGAIVNIEDNSITGIGISSTEWGNAAIMITDAYPTNGPAAVTIIDNDLTNNSRAIHVGYGTSDGVIVEAHFNNFSNTSRAILTTSDLVNLVNADNNWFGSQAGPVEQITGNVTLNSWCADDTCNTFLPDENNEIELPDVASTEEVNAAINNAPAGSTVIIPAGTYTNTGGFVVDKPGVTIILKDGVVIQNNSPCFEVNADNTTITTESPLGAKCVPTEGDHGIIVNSNVENVTIVGLEISGINNEGVDQSTGSGIYFFDDPVNVEIVDNYIHDLDGDGIHFSATPTGGYQVIQGNLFQNNSNLGIFIPDGTLNAEYNSWGDVNGPTGTNGDGVSAVVDYEPFTHVDLYLESAGTAYSDQVVVGQTITYKVMGNLANVMGAEVTLDYPDGLTFVAPAVDDFTWCKFDSCEVIEDADGKLSLVGYQESAAKSGSAVELFEVEFTGTTAGLDQALAFDLTLDNFSMSTPSGTSNTILASGFVDAAVDVVVAPELSVEGLDGPFYVGNQVEFTLTITNPTENGGTFSEALLNFLNFAGDFEYYDGANWVTGFPSTINFTPGDVVEIEMRGTFNLAGERDLQIELYEKEVLSEQLLDTLIVENVTVYGVFDVTGSISMQGRVTKAGVPIILTHPDFGVFSVNSTNFLSDNVGFTDLPGGDYTFTTNQPRYLNVHEGLNKTFALNADVDLESLELKGGNATNDVGSENIVNLADASVVAGAYGSTIDGQANVNFDGKVNIQDLALVGGNYGLTSDVYTDWEPLVKWDGVSKEAVTPVEGVYEISTAAQLAWIADQVSLGHFDTTGIKVRLTNDINLNGHEWTPIGFRNDGGTTSFFPFRGEFDGGGFTIDGLTITSATPVNLSPYFGGLIGQTAYDTSNNKNTEIKNLVMTNVVIDLNAKQGYAAAAVVGYSIDTNFENIEIFGTNNGDYGAAGLTLVLYGDSSHEIVVKNITNHMDITSQPSFLPSGYSWGAYYIAGGIVAQTSAKGSDYVFRFENCENYGDITQYNAYLPGADGKSPLEVGESFSRKLLAGQIVGQFSGGSGINYKVIVVDSVGTGEITGNHLIRFFDGEPTNILQKASFVGKVYISEDTNEDYGYTYADLVDLVIFGNESVYFTNSNPTDLSQFTLQGEESYFKISNKIYQKVGGSNVEILSTDAETVAKLVDWNKLVGPCPTPKVIIMASTK